jgi:hypothetical protein
MIQESTVSRKDVKPKRGSDFCLRDLRGFIVVMGFGCGMMA